MAARGAGSLRFAEDVERRLAATCSTELSRSAASALSSSAASSPRSQILPLPQRVDVVRSFARLHLERFEASLCGHGKTTELGRLSVEPVVEEGQTRAGQAGPLDDPPMLAGGAIEVVEPGERLVERARAEHDRQRLGGVLLVQRAHDLGEAALGDAHRRPGYLEPPAGGCPLRGERSTTTLGDGERSAGSGQLGLERVEGHERLLRLRSRRRLLRLERRHLCTRPPTTRHRGQRAPPGRRRDLRERPQTGRHRLRKASARGGDRSTALPGKSRFVRPSNGSEHAVSGLVAGGDCPDRLLGCPACDAPGPPASVAEARVVSSRGRRDALARAAGRRQRSSF